MKVVLFQSVDSLGRAGETVEVKQGYYRNYLGPRGIAREATPGNIKLLESRRKKIEQMVLRERSDAEAYRDQISGTEVSFTMRANDRGVLFGSITTQDVADAIKAKGFEVDRRRVEMDHIRAVGTYKIRVRVYPEIFAEVVVKVEKEVRAEDQEVATARRGRKAAAAAAAAEAPAPEATAEAGAEA